MEYGISLLSIIPVRAEPREQSEQTSQLLFGETCTILDTKEKWLHIRLDHDGYQGWVNRKTCMEIGEDEYNEVQEASVFIVDSQIAYIENGDMQFPIVLGSSLPGFNDDDLTLTFNGQTYSFQGLYKPFEPQASGDLIVKNALRFKGAPYLWGGRSLFGVDCSGFTQIVFKMCGFMLPRDAYQQVEKGIPVETFTAIQPGDLAFFPNAKGKISHVGILLNDKEIIHAYGSVRTDHFDERGIINAETGTLTHTLSQIRRYIKVN